MKHTSKEWLAATRFWSFPVSVMPVAVTIAYLCSKHLIQWNLSAAICALLCLVGIVIIHASGNLLSDFFDFKSGVDNEKAFAVPNLVFHKFEPSEYLTAGIVLMVLGCGIGLVLMIVSGWKLIFAGLAGVALMAGYSFLKYHALGDLDIFFNFSIIPILGTSFVMTGDFYWPALVLALPVGLITVSVLHANNTRDIVSDKEAGIKTFAMLLGVKPSCRLYIAYMIIPFVLVVVAIAAGWLHWLAGLCVLALVKAVQNIKVAAEYKEKGAEAMTMLDLASSQLQLAFSGLLVVGLLISAFI